MSDASNGWDKKVADGKNEGNQSNQQKFVSAIIEWLQAGTINVATLKVSGDATVTGNIVVNGNLITTEQWLPYPAGSYSFPSGAKVITAGSIPIGAATTAPTFGNGTILQGYYKIHGKLLDILFGLNQTSAVSAANGSGNYYIAPPLGVTIDTSYPEILGAVEFTQTTSTAVRWGRGIAQRVSSTAIQFLVSSSTSINSASINEWGPAYYNPTGGNPILIGGVITDIPIV
jgi:hypothetical protein